MVSRLTNLNVNISGPNLPLRPTLPTKLPEPTPDITLPPNLKRPPTAADLIINRTFDGLTPQAAAGRIREKFKGTIAPQNEALVKQTVDARVRDMQVALNNVFTPGTPNRRFLESQLPATLRVIGSLSQSNPVVYEVSKRGEGTKYYTKSWSGSFVEMPKPPAQVVMSAQVTLEPRGLQMNYTEWSNKALAGQITTITEL
ncbi:MAG: hypothetical protein ACOZQL_28070 [Myxococcota bacterium]